MVKFHRVVRLSKKSDEDLKAAQRPEQNGYFPSNFKKAVMNMHSFPTP